MRFTLPNIMVGHIYTSSNTVVIQAGNKAIHISPVTNKLILKINYFQTRFFIPFIKLEGWWLRGEFILKTNFTINQCKTYITCVGLFYRNKDAKFNQEIICCELFTQFSQFLNLCKGSAESRKKKIKHMQSKTASKVKEVSKGDELQCQSRVNKWNYLQYNIIICDDILFII